MYTIIFDPIADEALDYAKDNLKNVVAWNEYCEEDYKKAEAIIVRIHKVTKELIDKMPNLKIIAKHGVGTDNIDKEYAREKGITVTNTPLANSSSVAELAVALALAVSRRIVESHLKLMNGVGEVAPKSLTGFELLGKNLGMIGFGHIGSKIAKIFSKAFEMKVLVFDPYLDEKVCEKEGYFKINMIEDILIDSDIINISVPLTDETRNMISKKELDLVKKNAVIINTSRGGIINEEELYKVLESGKIYGAAVDAFEQEPLSKDSPLLRCKNFIASPHNGANTIDSLIRMGKESVDEIVRKYKGQENINVVLK
ncbi:NAD(P)-dependent oxidoreductase [Peptoniphilaceae bacterium SGI.131]